VWAWGINSKGQLGDNTTSQRNSPVAVPGLTGVSAVAAGEQFSIALKSDGTVWAWGDNAHGQLGDGTTTERHVPVRVTGLTNVVAIGAGYDYAVALLNNGNIRAWGNNGDGQLGDGSTTQRLTPVSATGLPSVSAIAVGHSHVLAIANNGDVWAWGNNINGQLGYPTGLYQSQATPAQVPGIADIVAVGAGMGHSLAIAEDGAVWAWGYNYYGQLGDGTTATRSAPVRIAGPCFVWKVWAPLISPVSGTYNAVQTATITDNDPAATLHYALTGAEPVATDPIIVSGGTIPIDQSLTLKVSAWKTGAPTSETTTAVYELKLLPPSIAPATGSYGGSTTVTLSTPVPGTTITYTLDGTEPTESSTVYSAPIVVGQTLTLKARVYKPGWTASDSGYASYWITEGTVAAPQFTPPAGTYGEPQLIRLTSTTDGATIRYTLDGTDPMETSPLYRFPFLVSVTTTVKARAFRTGMTRSAIATATYALDAAGSSATPTLLPAGGRFTVRQTISVQAPAGATVRYTVDGRDPADSDPLVGPERTIVVDRSLVLKVRAWASGLEPSAVRSGFFVVTGQVAAGYVHTIALTADGTVWSWGYNYFGTIGDGTTTNRLSPVQVGISDVQAVAGGYAHTLALKRDGTVWAWGLNDCGQLGDNTTTNHSTPVQVIGLTNVVAIAAGGERDVFSYSHSLALKADGTVWAWGCNQLGQLGDGTTTTRKTPVQVTGLGGVTAIAAGGRHSIAVEGAGAADGVIWTWGNNQYGTLGDGSTISRSVAVRLPVTDVIDLVASTSGALARLSDGTVWRWGVGVRLDGMPTTPTPLPFVQRASVIGAGNYHAFALDRDEIRWGWGGNSSGQLAVADYSVSSSAAFASNRVWEGSPGSLMLVGGRDHSVLLRVDGTVAATGNNQYGQLGNGTTTNAPQPVVVPGLSLADNAWLVSDGDNDGLTAWREWLAGTDPYNADTNRNGILDGIEESDTVSALNPDTDGDGLSNAAELLLGTDPYVADTDGDGVPDGVDAFPLDPTRSAMPPPNPLDTTPPVIILKEPTTARPVGGGGL
jgi:alpha-tubulin suppressor-like RCC1 family protein